MAHEPPLLLRSPLPSLHQYHFVYFLQLWLWLYNYLTLECPQNVSNLFNHTQCHWAHIRLSSSFSRPFRLRGVGETQPSDVV